MITVDKLSNLVIGLGNAGNIQCYVAYEIVKPNSLVPIRHNKRRVQEDTEDFNLLSGPTDETENYLITFLSFVNKDTESNIVTISLKGQEGDAIINETELNPKHSLYYTHDEGFSTRDEFGQIRNITLSTEDPGRYLKGVFGVSITAIDQLEIDIDSAGVYSTITDDGASGDIELSINLGAYGPFSGPLTLEIGDTVDATRVDGTSIGWFKLTGAALP